VASETAELTLFRNARSLGLECFSTRCGYSVLSTCLTFHDSLRLTARRRHNSREPFEANSFVESLKAPKSEQTDRGVSEFGGAIHRSGTCSAYNITAVAMALRIVQEHSFQGRLTDVLSNSSTFHTDHRPCRRSPLYYKGPSAATAWQTCAKRPDVTLTRNAAFVRQQGRNDAVPHLLPKPARLTRNALVAC
jgi:hypothetical protein